MSGQSPIDPPSPSDYVWIRAWGRMMGSFDSYIRSEQEQAAKDGAPLNATYRRQTNLGNLWSTTNTVTNPSMRAHLGLPPIPVEPNPTQKTLSAVRAALPDDDARAAFDEACKKAGVSPEG